MIKKLPYYLLTSATIKKNITVRQLLLLLMLVVFTNGYTQNESNIWYFGFNTGLDFNSNLPVVLTNGQITTDEGCASISTPEGVLMFYTDGITVYNSQHTVMVNGTGLLGDSSSTQSAIIVPKPCAPNIYYIFTTMSGGFSAGLHYSEVDMSMGNGLGAVTENKNIELFTPVIEKLAAVPKADGTGFWILAHGFQNNQFRAYSVTADGVNTNPVLSNSGTILTWLAHAGCLTPSHDGTKLVSSNYLLNTELFDFDAMSGIVSNGQVLDATGLGWGAEFSPSGNMLYISTGSFNNGDQMSDLLQYDLTAGNIPASAVTIVSVPYWIFTSFGMQLAPNGKIYIANPPTSSLSVINNPDVLGTGCGYISNAITFPNIIHMALPQEILPRPDVTTVDVTAEDVCLGNPTVFGASACQPITSAIWDFGDGTTSAEMAPLHTYTAPGLYNVVVTAQIANASVEQTYQVTVFDTPVANEIPDQTICGGMGMTYDLAQNDAALWGPQASDFFIREYYASLQDAQTHTNPLPINYPLLVGSNTFYAEVYNPENPACYGVEMFTVNLSTAAPVLPVVPNLQSCDNAPADGFTSFNLTQQDAELLAGQTGSTVTYYTSQANAEAATNHIAVPAAFTNTINPQTIYAAVTTATGCKSYTSFTLNVMPTPVIVALPDIEICDDTVADGFTNFNLTQQDAALLAGQTGVTIAYYTSQADADINNNPIATPTAYVNTVTPQNIYVRVSSATCYVTTSFAIVVKSLPMLNILGNVSACDGYILPVLNANNSYYTSPGGTGAQLAAGSTVTTNQTVYVHAVNGVCSAESSFTITITPTPTLNPDTPIAGACVGAEYILTTVFADEEDIYNHDNVNFMWTNTLDETIVLGTSHSLAINNEGTYHLTVTPTGGSCPTQAFIEIDDTSCAIQKGVSPGDADNNNFFDLSRLEVKKISIFNRYGLEVYSRNNYKKEWDGQSNSGQELPTGTYFYMFERANGESKTGWIYINRRN